MLTSHWQDAHRVYVYEIDLRLDQGVLPAVDVAGDPLSTEILLGRNILNRLDLRLEGPAQITHLLA
jgi:hypothetical protein